ncbi:MAG: hypothetical protein ACI8ZM_004043 [Crocinitomix sp.]|jgi:hypothetical protein
MLKTILLIFNLFLLLNVMGQIPEITWEKSIGGAGDDQLNSVLLTDDGGYLLAGSSNSNISGDKTDFCRGGMDYWVLKLDADRNIEWQETIGGNDDDHLQKVLIGLDGGYLLTGSSKSGISGEKTTDSIGGNDYWIVKIDDEGNFLWDRTIGGSNSDVLVDAVQASTSGYVLLGGSNSNISGHKTENSYGSRDGWVVKIDDLGAIEWQLTVGGDDTEFLYSIEQTESEGYIIGAATKSGVSGNKTAPLIGIGDYWIIKLNEFGEILWDRGVGADGDSGLSSVFETNDGGFQISGTSGSYASGIKSEDSHGLSYWIVKLDSEGDLEWENTMGGDYFDFTRTAIPTLDEGSLVAGYSESEAGYDKSENLSGYWLVKLNAAGEIEWENSIGGNADERPSCLIEIAADEFIVGGYSKSDGSVEYDKHDCSEGGKDFWLIKILDCAPIDNNVTVTSWAGGNLNIEANAEGYTYQWYECFDNCIVKYDGKTGQQLDPPDYTDGDFSVAISDEVCEVFSECIHIYNALSVVEEIGSAIRIYPNPAKDFIYIDTPSDIRVEILNAQGAIMIVDFGNKIDLQKLENGFYTIYTYDLSNDLKSVNKLIKQ